MDKELLDLTKAYVRSGVDSLIADVTLTDLQKEQLERDVISLEQKIHMLVDEVEQKYPSIVIELSSRIRSNRTKYNREKGGKAQVTFVTYPEAVSPTFTSWD